MRAVPLLASALVLLLSPAAAWAQQERLFTVATLDDGTDPPGGLRVLDPQGRRCVLTGELAVSIAESEGVLTVGAVAQGSTLNARWVRAYAAEKIVVRVAGQEVTINNGSALKVVAREDTPVPPEEPEYYETSYQVELAGGAKVWLSTEEHDLSFTPRTTALEQALVFGRVERDAQGGVFIVTRDRGKLQVAGALRPVVAGAVGRFVEGFGIVFKNATPPLLQLATLEGTTVRDSHVHRKADAASGKLKLDSGEDVSLTGPGASGFLQVRYNWPLAPAPSGVHTSFVPAADVVVGHAWVDLTGTVVKKVDGNETRYAIKTGSSETLIEYGSSAGVLDDDLFAPLLGKTVRVAGDINTVSYREGDLSARSIGAVTTRAIPAGNGLPALPAGARLTVIDFTANYSGAEPTYDYTVTLPDGKTGKLGFASSAAVRLGEPTSTGIVSTLPGS